LRITFGIRPVADFETLNYQIMTDLNTSTEATITDETAIGFIPCYRLPFLSSNQPTHYIECFQNHGKGFKKRVYDECVFIGKAKNE